MIGKLAQKWYGTTRQVEVLSSAAGYYLGTIDEQGLPLSRESEEYFPDHEAALAALESGNWTQRQEP